MKKALKLSLSALSGLVLSGWVLPPAPFAHAAAPSKAQPRVLSYGILPKHLADIRCVITFTEQTGRVRQDRRELDEWRNGRPVLDWYLGVDNFYGFDITMEPRSLPVSPSLARITIDDRLTGAATEAHTAWGVKPEIHRRHLQVRFVRPDTRSSRQQWIQLECQRPLVDHRD